MPKHGHNNISISHYILIALFFIVLMLGFLGVAEAGKINSNVNKALHQGETWRSLPTSKGVMFDKIIAGYKDYAGWIYPMRGLRMASKLAIIIHIESKFDTSAKTKDLIMGEVGLMSLKRKAAEEYNVNACHGELNIWGAQKLWHLRRAALYEQWSWLADADENEARIIIDMAHHAGHGATTYLVNKATQGGKVRTDKPYTAVKRWIRSKGNALYNEPYKQRWGKQGANVIAFRVGLSGTIHERALELQNGNMCIDDEEPVWDDIKPDSSKDWPFPGHSKHRRCQIFKDIKGLKPSQEDNAFWIKEMKKDGCAPQGF